MAPVLVVDGDLGGFVRGGDPATFYPALWRWLVRGLGVRSVLDLGCGEGHAARFFRELGCAVLGVDGSAKAIARSVVPQHVTRHDLATAPFTPDRSFDLVWACEVVEHVREAHVDHLLATFRAAAPLVAMTHAFPGQAGHHHVNLQWPSYWIARMRTAGFHVDRPLTRRARELAASDVSGEWAPFNHFRRSGLVFSR